MWKCSMTIFLLALAVHGAHPRQPSPAPYKNSWHREKHASDLFLNRKSRAVDGEANVEASEQTLLVPIGQVSSSTQDLLGVCDCFVSHSARRTGCSYKIGEYGPLIINGTCFNGTQRKRRRRWQPVAHTPNNAPIEFPDLPWCDGTLPLLLVSSGEKKTLQLSNVPSVWVCPLSLGASLQDLSITNVPEIRIAPGALVHRLTDFTLNVTGVSETLYVPPKAFSVDTVIRSGDQVPLLESTVEDSFLPQVKILIENASNVKFESSSVSAPRVWVEVRETEMLLMEENAVKALSYPLDSALIVSFTQIFYMETHAATVKILRVTDTSKLLLKEESVQVTTPGGEVVLNQVGEVMLPERGIIVGGGASLELTNVSLSTLGHRAVHSSSPLSSSSLMSVEVTGPASTPICLSTQHLILKDMTAAMGEHSTAAACFRFSHSLEVDKREPVPGVVLSKTTSSRIFADPQLFSDPRCAPCNPQPTVIIESTPPPIILRTTTTVTPETPHPGPTPPGPTPLDPTPVGPTHRAYMRPVTTYGPEVTSATEQTREVAGDWWEEPKYLGPAAAFVLLVILLLLFFCLYRLHKRSKRAKYELPQTFRTRTFPRTIVTPDTLDAAPPGPPLHAAPASHAPAELFVSYHVSHGGPSLHQAAVAQHQLWQNGRTPEDPNTAYRRDNHHSSSCHNGSLMAAEDDCSISSTEIII